MFPRQQVSVFIDRCFWHGCPTHGRTPQLNRAYWAWKIARNVERDARNTQILEDHGWCVIRIWEHEDVDTAVERVARAVHRRTR